MTQSALTEATRLNDVWKQAWHAAIGNETKKGRHRRLGSCSRISKAAVLSRNGLKFYSWPECK